MHPLIKKFFTVSETHLERNGQRLPKESVTIEEVKSPRTGAILGVKVKQSGAVIFDSRSGFLATNRIKE
jgi:hypothetical protein